MLTGCYRHVTRFVTNLILVKSYESPNISMFDGSETKSSNLTFGNLILHYILKFANLENLKNLYNTYTLY